MIFPDVTRGARSARPSLRKDGSPGQARRWRSISGWGGKPFRTPGSDRKV